MAFDALFVAGPKVALSRVAREVFHGMEDEESVKSPAAPVPPSWPTLYVSMNLTTLATSCNWNYALLVLL